MKKNNKIMALLLSFVVLFAAIGGTMAYLTAKEETTNVFTIGSVAIELLESSIHRQNPKGGQLYSEGVNTTEDQSGSKYASGNYVSDNVIKENAKKYSEYLKTNGSNLVPGRTVHKMPYVLNTGKNAAYVRIRFLIPSKANNDYVKVENGGIITNMWTTSATGWKDEVDFAQEFVCGKDETGGLNKSWPVITQNGQTINGVDYDVYTYTRIEPLEPGEMTYWNVLGTIGIHEDADADAIEKAVKAGAINEKGELNVIVQADAIQAEGFNNYEEAWEAFDKQSK